MAAKRKTNSKKKLTLSEFQAWLLGIEESHPDDWAPSPEQWQLIKSRLSCIVQDTPKQTQQPSRVQNTAAVQVPGLPPGVMPAPEIPSSVPVGAFAPPGASSIPSPTDSEQDPSGPYTKSEFS